VDVLLFGKEASLERWRGRAFWPAAERGPTRECSRDAYERVIAQEPPGEPIAGGPHRRAAEAILRYDIFPSRIVRRVVAREPLQVGDVVGAEYRLLPGVRIFFASRVTEVFDEARGGVWHTGFSYRTLEHHPELGEETFSVEKELATGAVAVALRSWSRPGTWLARVGAPLVRRMQVGASHAALDHLGRGVVSGSPSATRVSSHVAT
jgi:uncharacterized protein (UPF0548 family)